MRGRLADRVISVTLAGVATYVLFEARSYPPSLVPASPGPGLFPSLLAVVLLVLGALLWIRSTRGPRETEKTEGGSVRRPLIALGVIVVFTAILESTDMFLTLPLLLAAIMWLMGERRAVSLVVTPLLFDVFVYVVFYRTFGVPFPTVVF